MSWHYSNEGNQFGPISEAEFEASVKSGVIHADTMVWKEGLAEWTKYSDLSRNENGGTAVLTATGHCVECGKEFAQDEMVNFAGMWVCAGCKPQYVQKIKEGVKVGGEVVYGGFWARFGAKFLDNIITQIVVRVLALGIPLMVHNHRIAPFVAMAIGFVVGLGYSVGFVGKFGATPGKMALKLKIVRSNGEPITYLRAVGRLFAEMLSGMLLGIGYLMAAWDPEKRTLHDRICDTRVVKI